MLIESFLVCTSIALLIRNIQLQNENDKLRNNFDGEESVQYPKPIKSMQFHKDDVKVSLWCETEPKTFKCDISANGDFTIDLKNVDESKFNLGLRFRSLEVFIDDTYKIVFYNCFVKTKCEKTITLHYDRYSMLKEN